MLLNQSRAGGKNCREGEEQSCDSWTVMLSDEAYDRGNRAAEEKPDRVLRPMRATPGVMKVEFNSRGVLPTLTANRQTKRQRRSRTTRI
jgi:hypothetical protein